MDDKVALLKATLEATGCSLIEVSDDRSEWWSLPLGNDTFLDLRLSITEPGD